MSDGSQFHIKTRIPRVFNPGSDKFGEIRVKMPDQTGKAIKIFKTVFDYPIVCWVDKETKTLLMVYHFDVEDVLLAVDLAAANNNVDLPDRLKPIVPASDLCVRLPKSTEVKRFSRALADVQYADKVGGFSYSVEGYGKRSSGQFQLVVNFVNGFRETKN